MEISQWRKFIFWYICIILYKIIHSGVKIAAPAQRLQLLVTAVY